MEIFNFVKCRGGFRRQYLGKPKNYLRQPENSITKAAGPIELFEKGKTVHLYKT